MGYNRPSTYVLYCGFGGTNPNDSTAYYFGNHPVSTLQTSVSLIRIMVPRTGRIRAISLQTISVTATGTAEDIVMLVRKNNTTDYDFDTVGAAAPTRVFENYALDIPVAQGDYIEFKFTTPAWVTNPEGMRGNGSILIEAE